MGSRRKYWIVLVAAIVVPPLVLWAGNSGAAPAKKAPKTVFFGHGTWRTFGAEWNHWTNAGIGQVACVTPPPEGETRGISMPLDLPDGARITKVTVYHADEDEDFNIQFHLGFTQVGVSDIFEEAEVPGAESDEDAPVVVSSPVELQATTIVPTTPVVVDRSTREYGVGAAFEACRFNGTAEEENLFPSLILDGVVVEYLPA